MPGNKANVLRQLVTFGAIGAVSVALQSALYALSRIWTGPLLANLFSLVICTLVNTEANRRFTFQATDRPVSRVHLEGIVVFVGYYAVTSGALAVLQAVDPAAPRWLEITVLVASSLLGTVGRFAVLRAWVFRRSRAAEHDNSSA
ncbi:GtrA family protein [Amycolatopsis pithecellobii]|uniref:GtrA/DPMS transmembrane domain-containing protein n=1 Tax=Amycolatopsis pithecellobii TaxID=664692 RepID=A0A6N7Z6Z6_9PSEU|nr:GtrA family protein [Amycolatopsis pithecellobii]MTD56690.1 hypothetical protein [Amycolatopsis pithecellobii]